MPHTKSAKKSLRQDLKRRLRNKAVKKSIKLKVRDVVQAPKDQSADQLREAFVKAAKQLDKAAARRVIHPNQAARKKSQLARMLNQRAGAAAAK